MEPIEDEPSPCYCIRCGAAMDAAAARCASCGTWQKAAMNLSAEARGKIDLFRSGNTLIARRDAIFPMRCVRTNRPTSTLVRYRFTHVRPGVVALGVVACFCLCLFSPRALFLILLIPFFAMRRAVLNIPFHEDVLAAQRRTFLIFMIGGVVSTVFFPLAFITSNASFSFIGLGAFLGTIALAGIGLPLITIQNIDADFVYLKGACPEFLNALPEYWSVTV